MTVENSKGRRWPWAIGWYALSLACLGGWWVLHSVHGDEPGFRHGAWAVTILMISLRLLDRAAIAGRR